MYSIGSSSKVVVGGGTPSTTCIYSELTLCEESNGLAAYQYRGNTEVELSSTGNSIRRGTRSMHKSRYVAD